MTETPIKNVDGLLKAYYEREMPNPWPEFRIPAPLRLSGWPNLTRWAVAASVGLLLAGYLALAGFFPRELQRLDSDRNIGSNPVHKSQR
jgi:hypothetical protein